MAAAEEPAGEAQQQQEGKGTQKGQKRKQPGAASGSAEPAVAEQAAGEGKKGKNKKQPKQAAQQGEAGGGAEQPAAAADGEQPAAAEDVAALKKQLAVLSAENRALKRQQKKEARTEKRAAAEAKRKGEKAARRAAAGEAAATVAAAKAAAASRVDVSAWKDMELHPDILKAIAALGFGAPTQVQAECLPAAVRDRRDVIGAAQTGSGKTLAFGLPIMQLLLAERARHAQQELQELQEQQQQGCGGDGEQPAAAQKELPPSPLRALILAPTRELALQVCEHLQVGKGCRVVISCRNYSRSTAAAEPRPQPCSCCCVSAIFQAPTPLTCLPGVVPARHLAALPRHRTAAVLTRRTLPLPFAALPCRLWASPAAYGWCPSWAASRS